MTENSTHTEALTVENLDLTVKDKILLDNVSFAANKRALTVILGPNGAVKPMLLKAVMGQLPVDSGRVLQNGVDLAYLGIEARAQRIAYLPQIRPVAWPVRVEDIVALGRFAMGGSPGRLSVKDKVAIDKALNACALDGLAGRPIDTLSGGEQARVHVARALASEAPILIADEPVTSLDPYHQIAVLDVVKRFVADGGSALLVLHDLSLAARYADRLIWMKDGQVDKEGSVRDTLTPDRLARIYGINATVNAALNAAANSVAEKGDGHYDVIINGLA